MNQNTISIIGIVAAIAIAAGISIAGSQGGSHIGGLSVLFLFAIVAFSIQWLACLSRLTFILCFDCTTSGRR